MGERADRVTPSESFSDIRVSGGYASLSPPHSAAAPRPAGVAATATSEGAATIEDQIDQTRAEMSETIEAIQNRLDPDRLTGEAKGAAVGATDQARDAALSVVDHTIQEAKTAIRELADQAKADVRDATIGKVGRMATTTNEKAKGFGSSIVETVKQNPGPAALTALGIGWLLASGKSSAAQQPAPAPIPLSAKTQAGQTTATGSSQESSSGMAAEVGQTVDDLAGQVQAATGSAVNQIQTTTGQIADQAQSAAGSVASGVGSAAGSVASGVGSAAGSVASGVGSAASGVASGVGDAAGWVQQQARQSVGWARQVVSDRPLPAGAVAVALGGAAALAVPKSPRENRLLGEPRDQLVAQAESAAQGLIEKVEQVAQEAEQAAVKEAKYQGLAAEG